MAKKVKIKRINWSTIVKANEPKPEKQTIYKFSNGRVFKGKKA